MVKIRQKGSFKKIDRFLSKISKNHYVHILEKYGKQGVAALAAATPKDTGLTAQSWSYRIEENEKGYILTWENSNVNKYVNIALLLQYGHGTRNGGYVSGIDYINPALAPIFEKIAGDAWKEVTSA